MSKLHVPETFIGADQDEISELHSHDRFLDSAQEAGELAVSLISGVTPLPQQPPQPEHGLAA